MIQRGVLYGTQDDKYPTRTESNVPLEGLTVDDCIEVISKILQYLKCAKDNMNDGSVET